LLAQTQYDRYASTQAFLTTMSRLPDLQAAIAVPESHAARTACYLKLRTTTESLAGLVGFGLADASGDRICSSTSDERGGSTAADRIDFQAAVATREFAIGEIVDARTTNEQTMTFAIPVLNAAGNVTAVLRLGTAPGEAAPLSIPVSVPEETGVSVVDRNGMVINSSTREPGTTIDGISEAGPSTYLGTTVLEGKSREGADRKFFVTRVTEAAETPVYVVLSVPPAALATSLEDVLLPELVIVMALALATMAAAWFLGEFLIARPAHALVTATRRVRSGNLADPVDIPSDASELGEVGRAFQEMTHELRESREELERALSAKDEFLSLVSHELRTPITTIFGNAHVLSTRWETLSPELRAAALEDVREESQRLRQIIENLLVLARLETGRALEVEPLLLRRTIEKIMETHRRRFPGRRYEISLPDVLVLIDGNAQCIQQIMTNLLSNAEKYSPQDSTITVRIWSRGDRVVVAVEDEGIGLDSEEIDALFSPFYRSPRTAGSAGLGIGLSVCQRLVEAQGGRIWATPREGGGSVFAFTVPLAAEPPATEEEAAPASGSELTPGDAPATQNVVP
jgi:signal transduction histidine kinase